MKLQTALSLSPHLFKRHFGVQPQTFNHLVKALQAQHPQQPTPGRPPALSVAEEALVTLEYGREYRTYFHMPLTGEFLNPPFVASLWVALQLNGCAG
jgi:hypothetical protein